ncbi:MAG: FAD-binding oxidoreductase [Rhodospirillaceae bacterium]|nr:FAD-binding oxidoreductase [Rhodospirillaceae bacterium]
MIIQSINRRALLGSAFGAGVTMSFSGGRARAADLPAVTVDGTEARITSANVETLRQGFKGSVKTPSDADYESARKIWNAMFDRRPALIAQCASVDDVVSAVKFGRDHNLLTAVRCGGHSLSGQSVCERGLVIDLSLMRRVAVDGPSKTVRADGGCLLGDIDAAAQAVGLATTFGVVSHTGVGGLSLGGGMGRLQRQFGMSVDNILEVQVVTSDGRVVTANAQENSDLFWGVRGGGGNFGVVTSFKFQLHPFNTAIMSMSFSFALDDAKTVLRNYFDYANTAPEELWLTCAMGHNAAGVAGINISGSFMGSPAAAEAKLPALGGFGKAINSRTSTMTYVDMQKMLDIPNKHGEYHYSKGGMLGGGPEVTGPALNDAVVDYFAEHPLARTHMLMLLMGGAVNRVPVDAMAYPHRTAMHNIDIGGDGPTQAEGEQFVQWGRAYWDKLEKFIGDAFYVNALMDDSERRIRNNYGPNHERLVTVKTKYDPTNFFRLNANVKPKSA